MTRPISPLSEGSVTFRMQFGPEATGSCGQVVLSDVSSGGPGTAGPLAGLGPMAVTKVDHNIVATLGSMVFLVL